MEGETDPIYLNAAATLLQRESLFDDVEFLWVGAKDPKNGQGFHTGKDALNKTLNVFRANPGLAKCRIVLLYDKDVNKKDEDYGLVHVRSLPENLHSEITAGIENLLPASAINDDMYYEKKEPKTDGGQRVITYLDKAKLCNYVCNERRDPSDFVCFSSVLDMVANLARQGTGTEASAIKDIS